MIGYITVDTQRAVIYAHNTGKKRVEKDTRSNHSYVDYETRDLERNIKEQYAAQATINPDWDGPVMVNVAAYKALKENSIFNAGDPFLSKPDWDNIGKLICDALNKVAWKDDAPIIDGHVMKMPYLPFGERDRYEIVVTYLFRVIPKKE